MDKFNEKILKRGLGNIIDRNMDKLVRTDKTFIRRDKEEGKQEGKYLALDLSREERNVINDYIECVRTTNARRIELAYIAGMRDTIKFLNGLGLLKKSRRKYFMKP